MPTKQRVQGVIAELTQKLDILGYENYEVIEPTDVENDEDEESLFYIFVEMPSANFYIALTTEREYGEAVYPFRISTYVGNQLDEEEVEILCEGSDRDLPNENPSNEMRREVAGLEVIENTPIEELWTAKFNLSAYASTAHSDYTVEYAQNGFPKIFRCSRGILPYTDDFSLRTLDNRTDSVILAGKRGRRYVESALHVSKEGDPVDYTLQAHL